MKTKNWIMQISLCKKTPNTLKPAVFLQALIMAITFTIHVNAASIPEMNITGLEGKKALVEIKKASLEKSIVTIESVDGNIIYFKETHIQSTGFSTVFDFSNLNDGYYTVKVKTGSTLIKRDMLIDKGNIMVEPMKTEFDPAFILEGNSLRISYLNFDRKSFSFMVYKNGELIYNSELGNGFDMQKRFDFSWLQRGEYDVSLKSSGKEYWYTVKK